MINFLDATEISLAKLSANHGTDKHKHTSRTRNVKLYDTQKQISLNSMCSSKGHFTLHRCVHIHSRHMWLCVGPILAVIKLDWKQWSCSCYAWICTSMYSVNKNHQRFQLEMRRSQLKSASRRIRIFCFKSVGFRCRFATRSQLVLLNSYWSMI